MEALKAFFLGAFEFRSALTTPCDEDTEMSYEWGREWAHRFTFRWYEQ